MGDIPNLNCSASPQGPLSLARPIGIFDSGMGGMSIVAALAPHLQGTCYYVADDAYAPYGPKKKEEILQRAVLLTRQLLDWNCQLILVACNTATAAAIKELRAMFNVPLVGVEPYLNFLHQAALPPHASLAALMTPATFASEKYQMLKKKLDPQNQIREFTLPRLASLIESAIAQHYNPVSVQALQEELRPLQGQGITHLILGCTHYPLIAELIEDFLAVQCVGPSQAISNHTLHLLSSTNSSADLPSSVAPPGPSSCQIFCQKTSNPAWQKGLPDHLWPLAKVQQLFYHRPSR